MLNITEDLKEYAGLKIEEKEIKTRIAKLGPIIREAIEKEGVDKVPTTLGTFTIKKRKTWKYSEKFRHLEEELDKLAKQEEADGTATFTESGVLEFREEKGEITITT